MKKIILLTMLFFTGLANAEFNVNHNLEHFVVCDTKEQAIYMIDYMYNDPNKFKSALKNEKGGCSYVDSFKNKFEVFIADIHESDDKLYKACKLAIYEENNGTTSRMEFYTFKNKLNDPCDYYKFHAFDRYYDPSQNKDK